MLSYPVQAVSDMTIAESGNSFSTSEMIDRPLIFGHTDHTCSNVDIIGWSTTLAIINFLRRYKWNMLLWNSWTDCNYFWLIVAIYEGCGLFFFSYSKVKVIDGIQNAILRGRFDKYLASLSEECSHSWGNGKRKTFAQLPRRSTMEDTMTKIHDFILVDRRMKKHQITKAVGISKDHGGHILLEILGMRMISAECVPLFLTSNNEGKRETTPQWCLTLFKRNPKQFLHCFLTGDETWIHWYTPEAKEQLNLFWRRQRLPIRPKRW